MDAKHGEQTDPILPPQKVLARWNQDGLLLSSELWDCDIRQFPFYSDCISGA